MKSHIHTAEPPREPPGTTGCDELGVVGSPNRGNHPNAHRGRLGCAMRESAAVKARRYLTEGRLLVIEVTVYRIAALCRGDTGLYSLGYAAGEWTCDCPARSWQCSHLRALQLVTVADPQYLRVRKAREPHHA